MKFGGTAAIERQYAKQFAAARVSHPTPESWKEEEPMESPQSRPSAAKTGKGKIIVYWTVTALFCLLRSSPPTRNCACRRWRKCSPTSGSPPISGWSSRAPRFSEWCCCSRLCRRGSGVGLCRLRHCPRLGAHGPLLGGRWPRGVGLGCGHFVSGGPLVLPLAPPAGGAVSS
jgi:hypothetical protein